MRWIKTFFQILLATFILFLLLEGLFFFIGIPTGADTYIEARILHERLPFRKEKGEVRIFAYGESSLYGAQYAPVSTPPKWLEAYLKDFLPEKKIKVVNLARMGHGSAYAYSAFRDTVQYRPDIAIFYLGHNDFLPHPHYDQERTKKYSLGTRFRHAIKYSRLFSSVYRLTLKRKLNKRRFSEDRMGDLEIESASRSIVEPNQGEKLKRNSVVHQEIINFYRENVVRIVRLCEKKKVQPVFFLPVSNLKDFSPIHSAHFSDLSPENLRRWELSWQEGLSHEKEGRIRQALEAYLKAFAVDGTYADLAFRIGKIYEQEKNFEEAKMYLTRAKDYDATLSRAPTEIIEALRQVSREEGFIVIDTEKLFEQEMLEGIVGEPIIEDNVHPSVKGQALMARELVRQIAECKWISESDRWRWTEEKSFDRMAEALGVNSEFYARAYSSISCYYAGRLAERFRYAQKAIALAPKNLTAIRTIAWAHWLRGEKNETFEYYHQLQQIAPDILKDIFSRHPGVRKEYYNQSTSLAINAETL